MLGAVPRVGAHKPHGSETNVSNRGTGSTGAVTKRFEGVPAWRIVQWTRQAGSKVPHVTRMNALRPAGGGVAP